MIVYGLFPLLSYLLGALPFGFLLVRILRGVDLREVGSGNLGATNASRILGTKWFVVVFLFDFLKGFAPAFGLGYLAIHQFDAVPEMRLAYGVAAIIGHIWPVYLKFRGGKGVATAAGAVTGIAPAPTGIAAVVFFATLFLWRYVSLGSMLASLSLPIAYLALTGWDILNAVPITLGLIALLVVFKHRSNIGRITRGEEPKVSWLSGKKNKEEGDSDA